MITARQFRAARALLGWTQETLADKARVSLTEVFESTRDEVRRAFERAGIVFLNSDQGKGVLLVDAKKET